MSMESVQDVVQMCAKICPHSFNIATVKHWIQ